jgi:hypothetical protein
LDISFVKNVIKNYLPFISLEEALKEDLLTKERIKAYVLEYFQKNDIEIEDEYKEGNNIKDEKLNQIISDYKLSSIIQVNTEKDLLNDSEKVKKLLKNYSGSIAENIAEDWNMDFNNVEAKYNRD